MDIKTNYEDITISSEELFAQKQLITQSSMDISQKEEIDKILFNEAKCCIVKTQVLGKQIKIQGKTFVKICYCNKDGKINGLDYSIDFSETIISNTTLSDEIVDFKGNVVDSEAKIVGNEIRVQNVIQLWGYRIVSVDKKLLTQVDGAIYKSQNETFQSFERYLNEFEMITHEIVLEKPVSEVILYDIDALIINVESIQNKVNVTSQYNINIIYKSEEEIVEKTIDFTSSKEIDSVGINPVACPYLNNLDSRLIVHSDMTNSIRIEIDTFIKGALFNLEQKEIIEDLYSPFYELSAKENKYNYHSKKGLQINENRLTNIIKFDEEVKEIILAQVVKEDVVPVVEQENLYISEGIMYVSVVYKNMQDQILSSIVELPYSFEINSPEEVINCDVFPEVLAVSTFAKIRNFKEIEVMVNAISTLCMCSNYVIKGICEVNVGEEKKNSDYAIRIYKPTKGESMWDVSKKIGVNMKEIEVQNENINETMNGDENIIVYKESKDNY